MVKTSSLTSISSGICAETVASNMLHAYIQDNGFPDTTKFRHLASVERDHECRLEQTVLPHGPRCRFGNIMDFCTPQTAKHLEAHFTAGTCDLDTLAPVVLAPGAIKSSAFCSAHNKQCSFPRATGHSAGCPCTDFTTWGKQRRLAGPTVSYYLVWLAMRMLFREFWILLRHLRGL